MKYIICFVSSATKEFNDKEIEVLFEDWKNKNYMKNIQGFLLYSDGNFFQYLEGEKSTVIYLAEKIKKDKRHKNVIQVVGKGVRKGILNCYQMENLAEKEEHKLEVIDAYMESLKGMDPQIQRVLKGILSAFKETRIL